MTNIFQKAVANIVANRIKSQKRQAIRSYAQRLRLLQATYGKQATYTPLQVKKTLKEWGYSTDYDCYGLAMYCNDTDFEEYHRSIDESCDYTAMRSEISECLFSTDREFSPASLIDASFQLDANGHDRTHHDSGYADFGHHHDAGGSCDTGHFDTGGCSGGDFGGGSY